MLVLFILFTGLASSLYAADHDLNQLERIHAHFDTYIIRASNHHERAVIFDNAVKDIEKLSSLDESLKDQTFKHFVNTITRIEENALDLIVTTAPHVAQGVRQIESIEQEKHALLAQVDDLKNAPHAARESAKHYITKTFDDRKIVLAGSVGTGVIHVPEEHKHHVAHHHESTASAHQQHDELNVIVTQFYTDIHNKRLSSQQMQHKLNVTIDKINTAHVLEKEKEAAIKSVTQAAQAKLQEQGEKLPQRGEPKKAKRRLKGSVAHTEEEEKGRRYAAPRKPKEEPKSKESVTQEAARLRRERAAKRAE